MYSIIDIETNGMNATEGGKITEIAIYNHNGLEVVGSFCSLVNPETSIPTNITDLTGINNEMVASAPKFYEIAKQIVEFTAGNTFVAHNVNFDYSFIREEFRQLGYHYHRKKLCTVRLSRKLFPNQPSYSLGKLCNNLGIKIENRHRAAGDAQATVQLFEKLLKQNSIREPNLFHSV